MFVSAIDFRNNIFNIEVPVLSTDKIGTKKVSYARLNDYSNSYPAYNKEKCPFPLPWCRKPENDQLISSLPQSSLKTQE